MSIVSVHAEPARLKPVRAKSDPESFYLACSGPDVIDAGGRLKAFVDDLLVAWSLADEDLVIWQHREGKPPRVVAVLRAGPNGAAAVTYL